MSAIGALIIFMIFFILGLICIVYFIKALGADSSRKKRYLITSSIVFLLFTFLKSGKDRSYLQAQMGEVGIYYLTDYPNCDSCYIDLKENMTYNIINQGKVVETSNWHHEEGGDYWITYLNNDRYQLGSGEMAYKKYKLKQNNWILQESNCIMGSGF